MTTVQSTTNKRVYYHRLQTLLTEGGAYVLRIVFDNLTGVSLTVHLQNNCASFSYPKHKARGVSSKKPLINLTQKQYDTLFVSPGIPSASVTSADLDITLLVCLLQYTCDTFGLKKGTDRVWYTVPSPNDVSVEADIVKIRNFRNELSHKESTLMSHHDFKSIWIGIETVLWRLYKSITSNTKSLQTKLDDFKTGPIDEEAEERIKQTIEEWEESDKSIQTSLATLQASLSTQAENLQEMKTKDTPRLATLKAISERYFRRKSETKDMFVRTATYNKAEEKLNKSGIAILSGFAGEGKTTMALQLLINTCPLDKILKLSLPKDMRKVDTNYWNGIFIDDILGSTVLDYDRAKCWDIYLRDLMHDACAMKLFVVMTTRHNILCEEEDRLKLDLFNRDNVIMVSSSDLTKEEKKKILMIHLERNNRTLSDHRLNSCISKWNNDECKVGFPECAVMFASNKALFEKGPLFFASPFELFYKFISELSEDEFMILVFIWTMPSNALSKFDLEPGKFLPLNEVAKTLDYDLEKKSRTLRKMLNHHKDGLLSLTYGNNNEYTFSHNVIGDSVGLVLGEENPDLVIEYGSKSFILNHIATDYNTNTNDTYVEERRFPNLGKRLNKLIFDTEDVACRHEDIDKRWTFTLPFHGTENMRSVDTQPDISILDHEVFKNEKFIEQYIKVARGNNTLSSPVLEVFEHFRNPYCIVFGHKEMGISVPVVLLTRENKTMVEQCMSRDILTEREKYIALLFATRDNDKSLVQKLIRAGAKVNEDTLQIATVNENMTILKHLLDNFPRHDSPVKSHIQNGNSPLITASKRGMLNIVACLLNSDIDINYRNKHGQSALDKAVICNQVDICESLIQNNCNLNVKAGKFNRTPLHTAVDMGYSEIVQLLLQYDASVCTTDHRGLYPIHSAAVVGNIETVRLLLEYDRNLAEKPFKIFGKITTLYHYAVQKDDKQLLQLLIENGVDPNKRDCFGRTPLYFAVYHNKLEFVELLLENADVNIAEKNGYTPLHAAVFKVNPDLVGMLCRCNADIRMVDRKGNSLFHVLKNVSKQQTDSEMCAKISKCISILLEKDKEVEYYLVEGMKNKRNVCVSLIFDGEFYYLL